MSLIHPTDDPNSKQQWLHALGWWCQDGEKLRAVELMYGAYCQAMRDRSVLEYAELAPPGGAGAGGSYGAAASSEDGSAGGGGGSQAGGEGQALALASVAAAEEQRQGKHRGWKGWGASKVHTMRRKMAHRQREGSQDGAADAGMAQLASPSRQQAGGSAALSVDPSPSKGATCCVPACCN